MVFRILATLAVGLALVELATDLSRPPNIVFILADDLGKGLLPLYDAQVDIATPNIDRLAGEGVVFDNAYATPQCLTTRTALITGRYPSNNGIAGHVGTHESVFLDPQYLPSFALPLRQAGYATAVVGKWHGKAKYQRHRVLRSFGFDRWLLGVHRNSSSALSAERRVFFEPGDFLADRLTDFVVDFIGENKNRPFFIYYPMPLVHTPLVATPDRPEAKTDTEKIVAMTEYADKMVGRVLDALEANGVWGHTFVFFSGDNGIALNKGKWIRGKGLLTERGVNVPLIVGGRPVTQRGRTEALTDFTDMMPTLAALAGAHVPDDYAPDGHSIADFLLGRTKDTPRRWIASVSAAHPVLDSKKCRVICRPPPPRKGLDRWYWRAQDIGVVVRDKRYKLWHHGNGFRALFDLQADPSETVNLWDSEEPQVVTAKRRLLAARRTLPAGDVYVQARRLTPDYGLHSHWRFDRPLADSSQSVFADWVGGYDAEADARPRMVQGKFGHAVRSESLWAAKFDEFVRGRPTRYNDSFTVSAWVRMERRIKGERNVLRLLRTRDQPAGPVALVATASGRKIAARHWGRGMNAPTGHAPDEGWVHVQLAWGPVDGGLEAVLYLDGEAKVRSRDLLPGTLSRLGTNADSGLEIGSANVVVDDVAVWRQALTPAQVAALHVLGRDYGYNASEVDLLFNAPRDHAIRVGGRRWERIAAPADGDGLRVEETPEGVVEIHFGDGIAVRSTTPAAGVEQ